MPSLVVPQVLYTVDASHTKCSKVTSFLSANYRRAVLLGEVMRYWDCKQLHL
jgi:hypothetical protein